MVIKCVLNCFQTGQQYRLNFFSERRQQAGRSGVKTRYAVEKAETLYS